MKVLKFGADWCSTCLVMKPRWKKVGKTHPVFESEFFDYDSSPEEIEKYGIEDASLPIFIFLDKEGNEMERLSGGISEKTIVSLIEKYKDR